ncbi:MAG: futalosine hydrolase [Desulfotignum sp.]
MTGPVLILCATRLEMAAFLARHRTGPMDGAPGNLDLLSGLPKSWYLVISGPGVFNAARALTVCLERFRPAFIVHTGIAGVFDGTGLGVGDAAVAVTDTYIHTGVDTGCPGSDEPGEMGPGGTRHNQGGNDSGGTRSHPGSPAPRSGQKPLTGATRPSMLLEPLPFDLIPGQPDTRRGVYRLDTGLAGSCHRRLTRSLNCRVGKGPFVTVSAITGSFEKAAALSDAFSPVMESMEGAAAAHVAALYQVPMVQVRAGANRVGERDKQQWDIETAVHTVADICDIMLERGICS